MNYSKTLAVFLRLNEGNCLSELDWLTFRLITLLPYILAHVKAKGEIKMKYRHLESVQYFAHDGLLSPAFDVE